MSRSCFHRKTSLLATNDRFRLEYNSNYLSPFRIRLQTSYSGCVEKYEVTRNQLGSGQMINLVETCLLRGRKLECIMFDAHISSITTVLNLKTKQNTRRETIALWMSWRNLKKGNMKLPRNIVKNSPKFNTRDSLKRQTFFFTFLPSLGYKTWYVP